jgi:hypothetical protein
MLEVPMTESMLEFLDIQASAWKVAYIADNSVRDLKGSKIEIQLQDVFELRLYRYLADVLKFVDFPFYSSSTNGIGVAKNG